MLLPGAQPAVLAAGRWCPGLGRLPQCVPGARALCPSAAETGIWYLPPAPALRVAPAEGRVLAGAARSQARLAALFASRAAEALCGTVSDRP